ncbi:MAG: hypothetical protein D6675_07120 [Gemmatimonadetes bacterium]|nr:MAG: hypothetical protein D6675_07120 [Gemmatimonadota bacterium]
MALHNSNIRAEMVMAGEFPHLVQKYQTRGVPQTLINGGNEILGKPSEQQLIAGIQNVLNSVESEE